MFRGVFDRYASSELNQIEAAELLGISQRTFRRWCQRFGE
ncbi:MAG: helix-turn-helix domain-containing protein, partial [Rhodopila sp.]